MSEKKLVNSSKELVPKYQEQSKLFGKTLHEPPRDEESVNAKYLEQAGYIKKLMAGVYSYLPLGYRVLNKIENIIREEMNAISGQEMLMPALQPKGLWQKTDRWQGLKGIMYQFMDHSKKEVGLAVTHEEVIADIAKNHINSYKDLPLAVYQIQTKFRHELRPKSGLTRGREFSMKDLYSFHESKESLDDYYEQVKVAYIKIFKRCGLDALIVEASGGDFSKEYSHEFQVITETGEDLIYYCPEGCYAKNKEISELYENDNCPKHSSHKIKSAKAIEVGNIFKLGTKYSEGMGAFFIDKQGKKTPLIMASYGIGPSRLIGTIVEVYHDNQGIIWPMSTAPFAVHVIALSDDQDVLKKAGLFSHSLSEKGIEVLYDNRKESPGKKLTDSDLLGIPIRAVFSKKTKSEVELKKRDKKDSSIVTENSAISQIMGEF
ncbi:MAG: proline--tRNA ligase [bacterium]